METLLRGDNSNAVLELLKNSQGEPDSEDEDEENEVKTYVVRRLHHEGFTLAQARTAYSQLTHETLEDESEWDSVYEECLQWLCIHLDEDQLPEGFDPRGRTLDVVVAPAIKSGQPNEKDERVQTLATKYGIAYREAALVLERSSNTSVEEVLWSTFCQVAETALEDDSHSSESSVAAEEIEALQAIFAPEECSIERQDDDTTRVLITIPNDRGDPFTLEIVVADGLYPWSFPKRVLVSGGWSPTSSSALGGAFHVEMVKFIATLTKGEPMMYEIYGQATSLLHSCQDSEMKQISLMPALGGKPSDSTSNSNASKKRQTGYSADENATRMASANKKVRRPREKAFFWSKPPKDTPVATAFPKIGLSLSNARKGLPAAKARDEFLSVMKQADKVRKDAL